MLKRVHIPGEVQLRRNEGGRDNAGAPGALTVTLDKRILLVARTERAGKTTVRHRVLPRRRRNVWEDRERPRTWARILREDVGA